LGTPVVSLYGPTSPTRLGPFGQQEGVIQHRSLCGAACFVRCRQLTRCMEAISEEEVVAAIHRILARTAASRRGLTAVESGDGDNPRFETKTYVDFKYE